MAAPPPQIFADQLTLYQPEFGTDYAPHNSAPRFSDLVPSLD